MQTCPHMTLTLSMYIRVKAHFASNAHALRHPHNTTATLLQLVSEPLCLSCHCHFAVSELDVPLDPDLSLSDLIFDFILLHPTPQRLQPSAQELFSPSIHVLCWCHRLSVPIFSCSDFFFFLVGVGCLVLVSLVVLCLCRPVFSHGFDFLAILLAELNQ